MALNEKEFMSALHSLQDHLEESLTRTIKNEVNYVVRNELAKLVDNMTHSLIQDAVEKEVTKRVSISVKLRGV